MAGFGLLCILPIAVAWNLMHALVALAYNDDTFSHVPLIPLVTIFLIYVDRDLIFAKIESRWRSGVVILLPGAIIFTLACLNLWNFDPANQFSLLMFGLILIWTGAFLGFFGVHALRAASFPLWFLLFAVPIPGPILSRLVSFLQHASADATSGLFTLFRVPVLRQDLIFVLPGVSIRVAEECSGIRSTLALFITTVLAGHMFLRSRVRIAILCALVIPIAILKNGMRIAVLSCLSVYVNPGFLYGNLHRYGGIPFFVVGLVMLGVVLAVLRRGEPPLVYAGRRKSQMVAQ